MMAGESLHFGAGPSLIVTSRGPWIPCASFVASPAPSCACSLRGRNCPPPCNSWLAVRTLPLSPRWLPFHLPIR